MNFRNISAWSIRNPVVPIILFIGLTLAGIVSFREMKIQADPDIEFPMVIVSISQPGAAPSELVRQVIQPIEDEVASIVGVRHITSNATDSSARIYVEFELETDTDRAVNDVKESAASFREKRKGVYTGT